MNSADFRRAIYTAGSMLYGDSHGKLSKLRNWQYLNQRDVIELQYESLTKLLRHAHKNTPYYKSILSSLGVVTGSGDVELNRFKEMPLLDKSEVRDNYSQLLSRDYKARNHYENTSGGSTGVPVRFVQDKSYLNWARAIKMFHREWAGVRVGEPRVALWGSDRDMRAQKESYRNRISKWITNTRRFNAFRMAREDMMEYVSGINSFKPVHILAYAESIYELARFIKDEGSEVHSPDSIMTSAGTLYPEMRIVIEDVFRTHVFNRYGSREVGDIACECKGHQGLHVTAPAHYVEILNDSGQPCSPGEVGEIVVTSLINYSMPLVRYRIGDMGSWSDEMCTCGCKWPLLKSVSGRVSEVLHGVNGAKVHGEYLTHMFYFRDWVKQFQIVQESKDRLRIKLIDARSAKNPHYAYQSDLADIEKEIKFALGGNCSVVFEFVDEIVPSPSGKHRYVISLETP